MTKTKESEELKKQIKELKKKADEYLAGWKRAKADYINRERGIAKEKDSWIKFANLELILPLLQILDSFDQSLMQSPENFPPKTDQPRTEKQDPWAKGVFQIRQQFENFLQDHGIEKIKTVGEKFNPELHEAVEGKTKKTHNHQNIIVKEIQAGYKMKGEVIRAAKVVIN